MILLNFIIMIYEDSDPADLGLFSAISQFKIYIINNLNIQKLYNHCQYKIFTSIHQI